MGNTDYMAEMAALEETPEAIAKWLASSPGRYAFFCRYFGIEIVNGKLSRKDTDISATVEVALPVPGEPVFASMSVDSSTDAYRVARNLEKDTGERACIKQVQTHVTEWKTNRMGRTRLDSRGLPVAQTLAPSYTKGQTYNFHGKQARIRDEYWTDSRGYVLPETEQDKLSFKHSHAPVGVASDEHLPEYKASFLDGHEWWPKRHSILHISENHTKLDPAVLKALELKRDKQSLERKESGLAQARAGLKEHTKINPLVPPPPPDLSRMPNEFDQTLSSLKNQCNRMWQIMSGERDRLQEELSVLSEKRRILQEEYDRWRLQRKHARAIYKDAKKNGLGQLTEYKGDRDDRGDISEDNPRKSPWLSGDNLLRPYEDFKRQMNRECEFRSEELKALNVEIQQIERKLIRGY